MTMMLYEISGVRLSERQGLRSIERPRDPNLKNRVCENCVLNSSTTALVLDGNNMIASLRSARIDRLLLRQLISRYLLSRYLQDFPIGTILYEREPRSARPSDQLMPPRQRSLCLRCSTAE